MSKRGFICLAVMAVVLSACGSSTGAISRPPDPQPADSTPITAADPYAIPATIDAAYINRVMKALEDVRGQVRRDVYKSQSFSQVDYNKLDDIYDGEELSAQRKSYSDASEVSHPEAKSNPGDEIYTVSKIRAARSDCIAFEAIDDTNAVDTTPEPPIGPKIVVLWPEKAAYGFNPTPWKIEMDELVSTEVAPYEC
jgi:hypothetical protein